MSPSNASIINKIRIKSKIFRVCEVKNGSYFSLCELCYNGSKKYFVNLKSDPVNLFVDLKINYMDGATEDAIIKIFEAACLNRFTCNGESTAELIEKEDGEFIRFY